MTIEEQPSNVDNDLPPRYSQINLLATNHHARVDSIAASRQQQPPTQHEPAHHLASQLELSILASESVHWPTPSPPYESCCIVDERFMLLGHAVRGVEVMDLHQQAVKPRTILWIRVRQMIVNKPCRVILMIAGRNKRVRCYSLDAIRKLCYAIYRMNWKDRYEPEFDLPSISDWRFIASLSGRSSDEAPANDIPPPPSQSSTRRPTPSSSSTTPDELVLAGGLASKQHYLCNNVALQDYHYKLSECKDVLRMDLYQTSAFIFVSAMQKDKLVVWQHRRSDQDKPWRLTPMYKFKVYWIPAEPRWVSFADDRIALRYLLAVFSTEATAIGLRNSKVHTVPVDKKLTELYQTGWLRAQLDDQQQQQQQQQTPQSRARSHSTPQSPSMPTTAINLNNNANNVPPSSSFPDLTLTSPPAMQWTSLIQLPFYPSSIAANTLTTEYSNPPSYDTVVTCSPLEAAEPVALSSTTSPQLFFATLGRQSYIIDLSGRLFSTQVYAWTHEPQHIEFIQLGQQQEQDAANSNNQHIDTDQDWCVVGFSRESVELLRFRTGERVHRIMNGVSICFLGRWNSPAKHNRPKALFWSCATPQDMSHVYMLHHK
ncbi:hypothetical protein O0I10_006117 [Lichtheimia ornata]|uniref:CNH domain-containing protein n=1 Tax=Lichtheimia ornata TaxID=688661 RepID=A0AAD7V4K2_9FUNG|nr:uncharacterized protein O0I10_006117 [Lichtheimia ornata]KAJ8658110.1 hypothetical protein O0I10_006117 [Lichtheimia ornata]